MKKRKNLPLIITLAVTYVAVWALQATGIVNDYSFAVIVTIGINIILATSLNLVTGFTGQFSLGHAGFMSIGAYTCALITQKNPTIPGFLLGVAAGATAAALVGVLVGLPTLRLRGDYLAIATLGMAEIIRVVFESLDITGGGRTLSAESLTTFPMLYWTAVLTVAVVYTFIYSRHGRAVTSIREDEVASELSGIHITYYKVLAFAIAAGLAGIAGALYSHSNSIVPRKFDFNMSIDILIYVVLGGMGSITGSVIAASVLSLLPELLRDFNDYRMVVYALLLIIMMVFRPGGLLGKYEFSLSRLLGLKGPRRTRKKRAKEDA